MSVVECKQWLYLCTVIRSCVCFVYGHQMQTKVKRRNDCLLRKICLFKSPVAFSLLARQSFCGGVIRGSIDARCAMQKKARDAAVVSVHAVFENCSVEVIGCIILFSIFTLVEYSEKWIALMFELICFNTRKKNITRLLLIREQSVLLFFNSAAVFSFAVN